MIFAYPRQSAGDYSYTALYQITDDLCSLASLYSLNNDWNISFTEDIFVALKAFAPAKAYPFSKLPFSALIRAVIMQYGLLEISQVLIHLN